MAKSKPGQIVFSSDRGGRKNAPKPAPISSGPVMTKASEKPVASHTGISSADSPSDQNQTLVGTDGFVTWRRPSGYHNLPKPTQDLADAVARRNAQLDQEFPPG